MQQGEKKREWPRYTLVESLFGYVFETALITCIGRRNPIIEWNERFETLSAILLTEIQ